MSVHPYIEPGAHRLPNDVGRVAFWPEMPDDSGPGATPDNHASIIVGPWPDANTNPAQIATDESRPRMVGTGTLSLVAPPPRTVKVTTPPEAAPAADSDTHDTAPAIAAPVISNRAPTWPEMLARIARASGVEAGQNVQTPIVQRSDVRATLGNIVVTDQKPAASGEQPKASNNGTKQWLLNRRADASWFFHGHIRPRAERLSRGAWDDYTRYLPHGAAWTAYAASRTQHWGRHIARESLPSLKLIFGTGPAEAAGIIRQQGLRDGMRPAFFRYLENASLGSFQMAYMLRTTPIAQPIRAARDVLVTNRDRAQAGLHNLGRAYRWAQAVWRDPNVFKASSRAALLRWLELTPEGTASQSSSATPHQPVQHHWYPMIQPGDATLGRQIREQLGTVTFSSAPVTSYVGPSLRPAREQMSANGGWVGLLANGALSQLPHSPYSQWRGRKPRGKGLAPMTKQQIAAMSETLADIQQGPSAEPSIDAPLVAMICQDIAESRLPEGQQPPKVTLSQDERLLIQDIINQARFVQSHDSAWIRVAIGDGSYDPTPILERAVHIALQQQIPRLRIVHSIVAAIEQSLGEVASTRHTGVSKQHPLY